MGERRAAGASEGVVGGRTLRERVGEEIAREEDEDEEAAKGEGEAVSATEGSVGRVKSKL